MKWILLIKNNYGVIFTTKKAKKNIWTRGKVKGKDVSSYLNFTVHYNLNGHIRSRFRPKIVPKKFWQIIFVYTLFRLALIY